MASTNQNSGPVQPAKSAVKLKDGDQGGDSIQNPDDAQLEFDGHNPKSHWEWPEEGFAAHDPNMTKMRPTPLGMFIIYFSHMLRFVEMKRLTAFIHPSRFAATNSGKDCGEHFKINSHTLDTKAMRECYYDIRSRHPQVSLNFRFNLIPASMPGTSLIFPEDCHNAEKPSLGLFTLCGLNDVRTLGLPSYHYTNCYVDDVDQGTPVLKPEVFRYVAGPRRLFFKK
ncbi:uncharacterized protein FTOL_02303 [Fusarium torulosum]|uniref:Uncharacterized protein n=1 Tax=Fusarium torulosum TaxID=33205 RepID=A0AAE8M1T5_9HYPO|nr:uncharacterized protein FTOL_02303 [Fusarium torulosum]